MAAVKPITALVLAIMFTLMLANTSTGAQGDRELGVRIIAATMFKCALILVAAQNATLILQALNSLGSTLAGSASSINVAGSGGTANLGDQLRDSIASAGMVKQLGMMVILLIPWLAVVLSGVLCTVLIFVRFMQLYMLSAFASLPLAFLGHEDTKGIAIGYLKKYATTILQGVMLIIAVKLYQALIAGWLGSNVSYGGGDMWKFVISNTGKFFVAPIALIFLLFGANGMAKAVVREG